MSTTCCVTGCPSRVTVAPGVVFFPLPLNRPQLLRKWLIVMDWVNWVPNPSQRICSLHFCTEDYISKPNEREVRPALKPDAIPSFFPKVVKKDIIVDPNGLKSDLFDNNEGQVRTCIAPILKISEKDVLGDNQPKELFQCKLKLQKEIMYCRNKVHKKHILLEDTVSMLEQKVTCLDKSFRRMRKLTSKMLPEETGL